MSDIVDFKLTLNDKEFSASIQNAGKLLETFGKTASNNSKKVSSLERAVVSTARSFSVFGVSVTKSADKLEDFAAGTELAGQSLRAVRENLAAINRSMSVFATRIDTVSPKLNTLTAALKRTQTELLEFADFADHASKSAKKFSSDASDMGSSTSSLNRRLSNTSKVFERWQGTTDKAANGLKNVRSEMDAVINRQKELSGKLLGGGRVSVSSSSGGSSESGGVKHSSGSSSSGHGSDSLFEGLKGNIFLLGEIGDAARTVKELLFGWQEPLIEAMSKMQNTRILLQGLEKDAANPQQAAGQDMSYIMGLSEKVHVSLDAVSDAFVKLKSGGIDPAKGGLDSLVNSVAQFGGDSEILKRAAVAIQQMAGKGVISMEELRQQLGEAVPTAMQSMADTMGVSMAKLVKDVSNGSVEAKAALEMLFLGMEIDSAGAADRLSHTFSGALAQAQTAFMRFSDNMAKGGYLDTLTDSLKQLSSYLNTSEGEEFALKLGQGLSSVVKTLTQMATWLTQNYGLITTIAEVVGAGMGFKLLQTVMAGTLGSSLSLLTGMNSALGVATRGVGGLVSVVSRLMADIKNFGLMAAAIINITEAIKGAQAAWIAFTAVLEFNPIILGITAVVGVVALLATSFESVADKAQTALEKIKQIPAAMSDADRSVLETRLNELRSDKAKTQTEYERVQKVDPKQNAMYGNASASDLKKQLDDYTAQEDAITKALGESLKAVTSKSVSDGVKNGLEKANSEFTRRAAALSSSAKNYRESQTAINSDQSLTSDQKTAKLAKLNQERQQQIVDATEKRLSAYTDIVDSLQNQRSEIDASLKSTKLSDEEKLSLQAKSDAIAEQIVSLNENQLQMAKADVVRAKASMSGNTPNISGPANIDGKLTTIRDNAGKKNGDFVDSDTGSALRDLLGNVIKGTNQMTVNQRFQSALGGQKYSDLSKSEQGKISQGLEEAVKADKAAADKRLQTANISADKQQTIDAMIAKANQQVVSSANELAGQLGLSSKASASFDEQVKKTLQQIDSALKDQDINGKPLAQNARYTDAQKQQLLKDKSFITNNASSYSQNLNRDAAEQTVSKFTKTTGSILSSYDSANRQEALGKWKTDYLHDMQTLKGLIDTTQSDSMREVYQRDLKAMQEGGNRAFIQQMGTDTQKLALQYEDVAGQIETAWSDAFSGMTDTITDFIVDGKASFSDLARSILKDIASIIVKSQITAPLMNMMGMGAGGAGNTGSITSAVLNQGVNLASSSGSNVTVNNGDKSVGQSVKETSVGIAQMSTATADANSGLSGMISGVWTSTKSMLGLGDATSSQTKSIVSNVATMKTLSSVSAGLAAVFASMGASATSSKGRWLNFGMSLTTAAVSAWAGSKTSTGDKSTGGGTSGSSGAKVTAHANGGVFGPRGAVPLNTYSKGGIATSPQLALFGEGRTNEAYVPLPDGRSIPVTMSGGAGSSVGTVAPVAINISVNSDGTSSSSGSSSDNAGWNDAAQRIKNIVLDTITQEKRPGGSLNKNTNGNR